MADRCIAYLHAPYFAATLAQRAEPALTGRPFFLLDEHGQVLAADSLAGRMGVVAGQTERQAIARCPGATETDGELVAVGRLARLAHGHNDPAPVGILAGDGGFHQRAVGDRLRFSVEDPDEVVPRIDAALKKAGAEVSILREARLLMEDVFIYLVEKRKEQA